MLAKFEMLRNYKMYILMDLTVNLVEFSKIAKIWYGMKSHLANVEEKIKLANILNVERFISIQNLYSLKMTQHLHLLASIGFDTAENEPSKVWYQGLTFYFCLAYIPSVQPR